MSGDLSWCSDQSSLSAGKLGAGFLHSVAMAVLGNTLGNIVLTLVLTKWCRDRQDLAVCCLLMSLSHHLVALLSGIDRSTSGTAHPSLLQVEPGSPASAGAHHLRGEGTCTLQCCCCALYRLPACHLEAGGLTDVGDCWYGTT